MTGQESLAFGMACDCKAGRRRLEIARDCRGAPGPLSHRSSAMSVSGCCGTEQCSDPCSGDLCDSKDRGEKSFKGLRLDIDVCRLA